MALTIPGGFSADDVKNGARLAVRLPVTVFTFRELWDNDIQKLLPVVDPTSGAITYEAELKNASSPGYIDEGAPSSVALTVLAVTAISMVVFATIMLMERTPRSEAPKWKEEAAGAQVYVSVLALLTSAFYAGYQTTPAQTVGEALQEVPAGMFLGLALLKIVEFGSVSSSSEPPGSSVRGCGPAARRQGHRPETPRQDSGNQARMGVSWLCLCHHAHCGNEY